MLPFLCLACTSSADIHNQNAVWVEILAAAGDHGFCGQLGRGCGPVVGWTGAANHADFFTDSKVMQLYKNNVQPFWLKAWAAAGDHGLCGQLGGAS